MNPTQTHNLDHSHLFLVRVWPEQDYEGQMEWRGKLQHVVSGEARYFRGCPQLADTLLEMMQEKDKGQSEPAEPQSQERGQQPAQAAG